MTMLNTSLAPVLPTDLTTMDVLCTDGSEEGKCSEKREKTETKEGRPEERSR